MTEKHKLKQEDINSMDLTSETLAKLKQILPEVFAEGADGKPSIDMERLKIALGGEVDIEADDKARYSFNWSGKKQAQALANQPSPATLRPSVEDSKNWDDTQNIYIEGDNLEVLKLLQKSYYGQIKMIYIDPPYNTGKDFVYKDNFHDNVKNYLQLTGQVDDEGNKISTNTDKSGRYHTDWLNMMYPRLKLARNLLRDDGVIFISIDDNEVHNLRKICDEIFGEDNFIDSIIWKKRYGGGAKEKYLVSLHEYVLVYAKSVNDLNDFFIPLTEEQITRYYTSKDEKFDLRGGYRTHPLEAMQSFDIRENLRFPVIAPDGSEVWPKRQWRWSKETFDTAIAKGEVEFSKNNDRWVLSSKQYLKDDEGNIRTTKPFSIIDQIFTQHGTNEVISIFGNAKIFDFPKPSNFILQLISIGTRSGGIILDFFSGSATTSHAAMQLNAEDGGNRKYICVQLPEATSPDSEAYKAGYKNICEIGKERIRRAGEKVFAEWQEKQIQNDLLSEDSKSSAVPDIGFKVFKLDTSNFKPFDGNFFSEEMILSGRTSLDLFYELVLKQGYSLDYKQQVLDIGGTRCYALVNNDGMPFVLAVLDDAVKANFALELLKYALTLVIIKDDCFATDEIKLNTLATLEQLQSKDNPLQIRIV